MSIEIDFNATVTAASLKSGTRGFFRWWGETLRAALPAALVNAGAAFLARSFVRLEPQGWMLCGSEGGQTLLAPRAAAPGVLAKDAIVVLPDPDVLRRTIILPAAARARLREAVGLQIERLGPFRKEDALFDCRIVGGGAGDIEVAVAIVPAQVVERYAAELAACGYVARAFTTEDGTQGFERSAAKWWASERGMALACLGLGAALWLGALLLAPALRSAELASLADANAQLRSSLAPAIKARDALRDVSAPLAFVAAAERRAHPLDVLNVITEALPANVRVVKLAIDRDGVTLTAAAPNAGAVLHSLARARSLSGVKLLSTIRDGSGQRFVVGFRVRPSARPS